MANHVVYLPGVGDHNNSHIQIKAVKKWRKYGLETHFHQINWNDNESFDNKLNKILKIIDELYDASQAVSIVGVSAGASMAMNVYEARKDKIRALVFICGKINNPETLGEDYKIRNPRLFESVSSSSKAVRRLNKDDKSKMLTVQPIYDGTVAMDDGRITGARHKVLFSALHAVSIYLAITLYRKVSINFIKSKA